MPKARKDQVSLKATPYYHCTSRCVRRAFLCGEDHLTGKSYEHRRQWVEDRLLHLASVFAIDICAYAVMSNHLHVVLHINEPAASELSDMEVCERWHRLYKGTFLTQKYVNGLKLSPAESTALATKAAQWREQLMDISWFMRALNEPIARQANQEDECTGRFWEGRFSSQALLDEKALLACMAYVDLNPIRAKKSYSLEGSDHTSIQKRLSLEPDKRRLPAGLLPFADGREPDNPNTLPLTLTEYKELIIWTAEYNSENNTLLPKTIQGLGISESKWLHLATNFEAHTAKLIGNVKQVIVAAQCLGYKRTPGLRVNRYYFG